MTRVNWAEVAAKEYAVPDGIDPPDVLDELLELLASPDPEVRDMQAYSTLALWTRAGHFDPVLETLNIKTGAGLGAPDILTRSFSALILGEAVRRDGQLGSSNEQSRQRAMQAWQAWYPHEPDVRSWEPEIGWIHAVAHGADTAGELAQHPGTTGTELRAILSVLTQRIRTLPLYLNQTEDDRLALAFLSVLSRPELSVEELRGWLSDYQTLWTTLEPGLIPPGAVLGVRTLQSLHTLLHLGATQDGVTMRAAYPAETLAAVQDALRTVYPYYGDSQTG